ncbi:hypothetical protein [Plantactinospora soyae]|uniref:Uncharacterized protein n=1 Tax=Plantactinospora soyae TaxID=1544732 RepID=A0A927MEH3_9ACTN|nr:hypothetical protein [Plantactinospora soyae]MBE1490283.1 hypothetical protein [Plantactinospora soyae]
MRFLFISTYPERPARMGPAWFPNKSDRSGTDRTSQRWRSSGTRHTDPAALIRRR